jgi:hypothetical protein
MNKAVARSLVLALLVAGVGFAPAQAQEDPLAPPPGPPPTEYAPPPPSRESARSRPRKAKPDWELTLQPVLTLPVRVEGETTTDGLDLGFDGTSDTDLSGWALSTRVELWSPFRFGVVLDVTHLDLEVQQHRFAQVQLLGGGAAVNDAEVRYWNVDALLGFRLLQGKALGKALALDAALLFGAGYAHLRNDVRLATSLGGQGRSVRLSAREHWGQLVAGADAALHVIKVFSLRARLEVGSFNIGSAADLTLDLYLGLRWRPERRLSIELGYAASVIDFQRGHGLDRAAADLQIQGPRIAVGIHF